MMRVTNMTVKMTYFRAANEAHIADKATTFRILAWRQIP